MSHICPFRKKCPFSDVCESHRWMCMWLIWGVLVGFVAIVSLLFWKGGLF